MTFCKEYLKDLNASRAARRAGYSEKTAHAIGNANLAKPLIREYINKRMKKRAEKVEIDAEYVLRGIKETTESAKKSGDLSNSFRGYELLGKHLKLFTDKVQHEGNVTIEMVTGIDKPPNSKD